MARRGLFGTTASSGSVAGSVIKNILQMQGTSAQETPAPETKAPTTRKPSIPLTAEQIAKDPVFSGSLSYDQARVNYIKYQNALNKMPEAKAGPNYRKKLAASQKALAKLGGNPQEAERQFFALGGKLTGVGKTKGSDYGWSAKQILSHWTAAGMEDKGREIVAKLRGYDQYGNDVPGGIDTSKNINYTLGKKSTLNMKSDVSGLTAVQAARITKLKNLKQGGATLGPKQLANLKKLRALAKG